MGDATNICAVESARANDPMRKRICARAQLSGRHLVAENLI